MSRSCPACDQVHGKGEGGHLHESRDYPSLLHCNYCGRYYRPATVLAMPVFVPRAELPNYREVRP